MPELHMNRNRILAEVMKLTSHHRAFYCFLGMGLWLFFMITVMYKYLSFGEEPVIVKREVQNKYTPETNLKYRKLSLRVCSPADSIVRGSEAAVDTDTWLLHGVLVITRHGDRGPLSHLRGGHKLPCDSDPVSPLLKSYEEFIQNASTAGRPWWTGTAGPFHNFPALPAKAPATHCALGQLTPRGLLQAITVGCILKDAYADKLNLDAEMPQKKDSGDVISYSTRYRRTYQSLLGIWWGFAGGSAGVRISAARDTHSVAFCFSQCACQATHVLNKKINAQAKSRLDSHPAIKDLVKKISKVLFESQEYTDAEIVRDALLAYMCHDTDLPCLQKKEKSKAYKIYPKNYRKFRNEVPKRRLHEVDIDKLNRELEYINSQIDFNNEIGRKARDIIEKSFDSMKLKTPLDFDAQMEREKLLYYQQRYIDNAEGYDDVVVVKKREDVDFNFPNDAAKIDDFDDEYKETIKDESNTINCIKTEHVLSLFSYLEWSYRQEIKNVHNRKRSLLLAYGLVHKIVQNMIRMISENKPKFILYSGHDKTLQPLLLSLGINNYRHYSVQYASRLIFEVYRKKDLRDEFQFTKRKAVATDFYFRVVYNGEDLTNQLSFCKTRNNVVMKVVDPIDDMKIYNTYLCPIENIVRFIHDDYFALFNVSNFKDACASLGTGKRSF